MGGQWVGESTPYLTPNGDTWGREAAAQGGRGTQRITFVGEVQPDAGVAELLGLEPTDTTVMRRRLILLNEKPVEIADSYWPAAISAGTALASEGKIPGGAVKALADLGYVPAAVTEEVSTRPARDEECSLLALDASQWVLVLTRTITDASNRVYEVSRMVTPGRAKRLRYAMRVG